MVFAVPVSKNQAKRSFTHKTSDHQISVCWTSIPAKHFTRKISQDVRRLVAALPDPHIEVLSVRLGLEDRPEEDELAEDRRELANSQGEREKLLVQTAALEH